MTPRLRIACAWAGPIGVVSFLIAFWPIAGFIPPTPPSHGAAAVVRFYAEHRDRIKLGMILSLPAAMVLLPFFVGVSESIARIENRRFPAMAVLQISGAVILMVFFVLCSMLWITAAFRGDTDPGTIRTLNDFGWLVFVMVWPEYTFQMVAVAYATLTDAEGRGPWPRWFGYYTIWTGFTGAGGGLAAFFKHGPFAWNGIFGFYVPFAVFVTWLGLNTYLLLADVRR